MAGTSKESLLNETLRLLVAALDLIDRAETPGQIGAYMDMVVQQIRGLLDDQSTR